MSTQPFQSQSLDDWLFYLEQQHPKEIELGLDRIQCVAERANVTNLNAKQTVLVAGTNGKGTTIRFVEQALIAQGFSVGVFSSPHIFNYNERVRINGEMLADQAHIDAFNFIESRRGDVALTYFEFSTLASYRIFQQLALDVVLIEVGLGGRLDSTNIVQQDISVITSIGLDHTDWLGETKEEIAFEKAGIFKPGTTAIIGEGHKYKAFAEQADAHQVGKVLQTGRDFSYELLGGEVPNQWWQYSSEHKVYDALALNYVPVQNLATAITVLIELGIELSQEEVNNVIENFSLDGRMQVLSEQPLQMVDVAHNPHAVTFLADSIKSRPPFAKARHVSAVVAMMKDKDIKQTLQTMVPIVDEWFIGGLPQNSRAADSQALKRILEELGVFKIHSFGKVEDAWQAASEQQKLESESEKSLLVGFGSFFTVAEILNLHKE